MSLGRLLELYLHVAMIILQLSGLSKSNAIFADILGGHGVANEPWTYCIAGDHGCNP